MEEPVFSSDRPPHPGIPVSFDEYMEKYAAYFYEWVKGELISGPLGTVSRMMLFQYFSDLLDDYFALSPMGKVLSTPFVMYVEKIPSGREPDLMVILNDSPSVMTETALIGPADICIEIVSPESVKRDHGDKYDEYEKAGVREYWIIDPVHEETRFYRVNDAGRYELQTPDEQGIYQSPLLPRFALPTNVLWQEQLPNMFEAGDYVRRLLNADSE